MTTTTRGGSSARTPSKRPRRRSWSRPSGLSLIVGVVVVAGTALRFASPSDLWLDEALSTAIAELPIVQLPGALRMDGHPPLYYGLLHGWMAVFGGGDTAVRALSGVCSLASLPLLWAAAARVGGRRAAVAATTFLAASPFAIRYANEVRMYSLVVLLVLGTGLALDRALRRPSMTRMVGVALGTTALLLTHYWCWFLVASVAAGLAGAALYGRVRRAPRLALVAVAGGVLAALPWVPVLAYQLRNTGTPWAAAPSPQRVLATASAFAGGLDSPAGAPLVLGLAGLAVLSVLPWQSRRLEPPSLALAAPGVLGLVTAALAAGVVLGTGGSWEPRYASVFFPLYLLAAAAGWSRIRSREVGLVLVLVLSGFGLVRAFAQAPVERTNAGAVAQVIDEAAEPGDVVVYCPDQLGPAVSRLVEEKGLRQLVYPSSAAPDRVDWTDYLDRYREAEPAAFARRLERTSGESAVYLVWSDRHRRVGRECEELREELADRSLVVRELPLRQRTGSLERSRVERVALRAS